MMSPEIVLRSSILCLPEETYLGYASWPIFARVRIIMYARIENQRRTFRALHESGCFVIPNPWDMGSARFLASLGFKALASTSSGFAWSRGERDNALGRARVLEHLKALVESVDVPINADFENGFGADEVSVHDSVRLADETGIAGLSIEDSTGRHDAPLFDLADAARRIRAARAALDGARSTTMLVARAECYLVGRPDIKETILRLRTYADAGADCLYAPGIAAPSDIGAVVAAVAPAPVNLLVGARSDLTFQQIADLGVRRVSVGGALARAAWGGFMRAARALAINGSFAELPATPSHDDLDALFPQRRPHADS